MEILQYFGTYNGYVVVRMNRGAYQAIEEIKLGDITLTFNDSNTPLVWRDGEFFELKEAHDLDMLTDDDIELIAQKLN